MKAILDLLSSKKVKLIIVGILVIVLVIVLVSGMTQNKGEQQQTPTTPQKNFLS